MELVKRNIHMDCLKCKASTQIALEDDVNISDSRPDALKLIMDRGNVVIEEVRVTDDHVGVKGRLNFGILYLAEGKTADVAAMEGSIPFEEQLYMDGVQNGDNVSVTWEIEDLTIGLINSRKFSVQSLLLIKVVCEEIRDEETAVELAGSEPVEYRKKTLDIASMAIKKKDIFRIKDEVEIPGSFPNILSLIWWEIEPSEVEFKLVEDKINLQGEVRAFFLYRGEGEEGEICHYETTMPFSGSLDCNGAREGMIPEIHYVAEGREAAMRPDLDGEERIITFELCLNLDVCAYEEEQVDILADVYGVVQETAVAEREASFRKLMGRSSGKMKPSGHFEVQEGDQIVKVLHTSSSVQLGDISVMEDGIMVEGLVNLQILYESVNEDARYGIIRGSIPFQYVLEAENVDESCHYPLQANVEQITVSVIDGSQVDVKCVLFFHTNIFCEWKERIVESISLSELDNEKIASLPGIAVYSVREGESLWDIGKRYYVPVSVLRQTNELATDEVKPGDRILVVKNM